jgi:hypothetical protein
MSTTSILEAYKLVVVTKNKHVWNQHVTDIDFKISIVLRFADDQIIIHECCDSCCCQKGRTNPGHLGSKTRDNVFRRLG